MNTRAILNQATNVVLAACALTMTAIIVHRQFGGNERPSVTPAPVADWASYLGVGHRIGSARAPVTIVEFADFQCPACQAFALTSLAGVRAKYRDSVTILFRHWPLSYHHLAYPAARAAECAAAQGQFEPFFDLMYHKQDSLGLKPFAAYAVEAGVADLGAFNRCDSTAGPVATIERDIAAAKAAGGHGTPTIILNGLRLAGVPDSTTFDKEVRDALRAGAAKNTR